MPTIESIDSPTRTYTLALLRMLPDRRGTVACLSLPIQNPQRETLIGSTPLYACVGIHEIYFDDYVDIVEKHSTIDKHADILILKKYLDICLNIEINQMNIVFKALNDQTRRKILDLLKEKDMSAGEIADQFDFSRATISHHLELLQHADLVSSVKKGQFIIYSINTTVLNEISKWIVDLIDNQNGNKKLS